MLLIAVLALGFGGVYYMSLQLNDIKPKIAEEYEDDDLYFSAKQLYLAGHDFRGLLADWYWINSLQYLGNKSLKYEGELSLNDLRPLNPRLLYPMLDSASTLDPQFMTIYSYGAAILPAIDPKLAVKLINKGIEANPNSWRLYHNLGYIYWQQEDYKKAAETYEIGSRKPDAPSWMKQMSVNMQARGGTREFARSIYRQMYENAEDDQTREFADLRYLQVVSLDERDAIREKLGQFQKNVGRCPSNWREVFNSLRTVRLIGGESLHFDNEMTPVDPSNAPYRLINTEGKCDVDLTYNITKIPYK